TAARLVEIENALGDRVRAADEKIAGVDEIVIGDVFERAARRNALDLVMRRILDLPADRLFVRGAHVFARARIGLAYIDDARRVEIGAALRPARGALRGNESIAEHFEARHRNEIAGQRQQAEFARHLGRGGRAAQRDADRRMRLLHRIGLRDHGFTDPERAVVIDRLLAVPQLEDQLDRGVHHFARLVEIETALLHLRPVEAETDAELIASMGQLIAGIGLDHDLQRMVIGDRPYRRAEADLGRPARRLADDELGRRLMLADPGDAEAELVGGDDLVDIAIPGVAQSPG